MRTRRTLAALAAAGLGIWLVARVPPRRFANRVELLRRTWHFDAARRRFAGTSAGADRAFFLFLESARRALPPGTQGVVLAAPGKAEEEIHLAAYTFAPLPMRVAPAPVTAGWVLAVYGAPPSGLTVIRALPGGALVAMP